MVYLCAPSSALDSVAPVLVVVVVACESQLAWVDGSKCPDRAGFRHVGDSSCCAEVMSRRTCWIQQTLMHFRAHLHAFCVYRPETEVVVVPAVRIATMAGVVLVVEYMIDVGSHMNSQNMGSETAIVTETPVDATLTVESR